MPKKHSVVPLGAGRQIALCLNISPVKKSARAREPVKPTTGRVVGYYPSIKNNRAIAWESQLEEKACNLFEFSSVVTSYREQPVTIYYQTQGKICRYTPDFELTINSGEKLYVEIKPASKLKNLELKNQLIDISNFWKENGYRFVVITDEELNHNELQRNLRLLRTHLRHHCDIALINHAHYWLNNQRVADIGKFNAYFGSPAKALALIAQGFLLTDLSITLSTQSNLFIPEKIPYETCLFSYRIAPDFE